MSKYQLLLPKMGESVAEATIIKWLKKPGDNIETDEAIMEIATDKVDSEVPSPVSGRLVEQLCKEDDVIQVGAVIAIIETDKGATTVASPAPQPVAAPALPPPVQQAPLPQPIQQQAPAYVAAPVQQPPAPAYIPPVQQAQPIQQPLIQQIPGIDQLAKRPPVQYNEAAFKNSSRFYSPLVKHIATEEGISITELDQILGSGMEGRLTKDDLLAYVKTKPAKQAFVAPQQQFAPPPQPVQPQAPAYTPPPAQAYVPPPMQQPIQQAPAPAYTPPPVAQAQPAQAPVEVTPPPAPQPVAAPQPEPVQQPIAQQPVAAPTEKKKTEVKKPAISVSAGDEIIEMDRMRRLIADHMVMSKHTSPHVTSFVEADVTSLVMWRDKVKDSFEKREGQKITFTPIFIEAVVKAIKDMPMINVAVNGTQIIKRAAINISMATALPSGNLIVPVIKKADELSLLGLTKAVNDLAKRARTGKLQPDDVKDGTFTVTNVGSFGNIMGTPIINQPQVAILAVGAIKKKPAVIETPDGDLIAVRHMMFLSLSYDHRVVDGALGGSFVRKVADYLEAWDIDREF